MKWLMVVVDGGEAKNNSIFKGNKVRAMMRYLLIKMLKLIRRSNLGSNIAFVARINIESQAWTFLEIAVHHQ